MHETALPEIVKEIRSLEPLPSVVTRVLEIGARDDVVPDDLIDVMRTDLALTCKVLSVCNSAYYGLQREIASMKEAGNVLGASALVNLVLTCGANKYFHDHGADSGRGSSELWRRCLTQAISSKLVAEKHGKTDPELAYTAGLLQDVGRLVLDHFYDDRRVFVDTAVENGEERIDAERGVLGMSHAEVGARLMTRWCLSESLVDTARFHHKPDQADLDPVLASTTHLAETVGAARLEADNPKALTYEVSEAALELTGLDLDDFEAIDADLRGELERAYEMLAV